MINWEKIKRPYTFRQGSSLKEPTLHRVYREGSELALCSLLIATLFPGWVCLPHLQFWLRLNGGHISKSVFGAKLCFMTCHNFMTYSVMFLINSVKGDFYFK